MTAHNAPTRRPAGTEGDRGTRVLLAVMAGHNTHERIAAATGMPKATVRTCLERLRDQQLVAWEPGLTGTIRALVEQVA